MTGATQRWQLADVRITSVVEAQTDGIPPALFFAAIDEQAVLRHPWLLDHHADERGAIGMRVQAFVVEAGGRLVVVDPCVGNGRVREAPWFNIRATAPGGRPTADGDGWRFSPPAAEG